METVNSNDAVLQEVLKVLEVKRAKASSTGNKWILLVLIFLLILGIGLYVDSYDFKVNCFWGAGFFLFLSIVWGYRLSNESESYEKDFKKEVFKLIIKDMNGGSMTYEPNQGVGLSEFNRSMLFCTSPNRYFREDLVTGINGKTAFCFSEVDAQYERKIKTDKGEEVAYDDIFKGIIFIADFNKNFNNVTIVKSNDLVMAKAFYSINLKNNEIITLENPAFNEEFSTYSNDQIGARYILTPVLMEKILELNNKSEGSISLSFIDSKMFIAFPSKKDHFEAPLIESLLDKQTFAKDISVIRFMYDIASELDLNTRIWGKE